MAIRALQTRMASFLRSNHPPLSHLLKDHSQQVLPSASSLFSRYDFHRRAIQMETEAIGPAGEESTNRDSSSGNPGADPNDVPCRIEKAAAMSNLKTSSRHDLAMVFTCRVCETRSVKTVCRDSYEKGVVVVRCGGCDNLHLIADRLGWFGEPRSVEDFLSARGEEVKKGSSDSLSLTLEDLAGNKL